MRISLNWIKRLIDLKKSPEEIAKVLTSAGLEVESIEDNSSKYKNFVIGKYYLLKNIQTQIDFRFAKFKLKEEKILFHFK